MREAVNRWAAPVVREPAQVCPASEQETYEVSLHTSHTSHTSFASMTMLLIQVGRDTIATIGAQSGPILLFATMGVAGVLLAGVVLGSAMLSSNDTVVFGPAELQRVPLFVQGCIGLCTLSFSQGAIAWLVLRARASIPTRLRDAFRVTLRRSHVLILVTLLYGGLMYISFTALWNMVPDLHHNLYIPELFETSVEKSANSVSIWALQTAIPDPGAPFSQMIAWRRLEPPQRFMDMGYALTFFMGDNGVSYVAPREPDGETSSPIYRWGVGLSCMPLIFATETLLRMRTVMIMNDRTAGITHKAPIWTPLIHSALFGAQNYAALSVYTWLLRFLIWGMGVLFIALPMEAVRNWFAPVLLMWGGYRAYMLAALTLPAGVTLITLLLGSLSVVFDTCLYHRLARAPECQPEQRDHIPG